MAEREPMNDFELLRKLWSNGGDEWHVLCLTPNEVDGRPTWDIVDAIGDNYDRIATGPTPREAIENAAKVLGIDLK